MKSKPSKRNIRKSKNTNTDHIQNQKIESPGVPDSHSHTTESTGQPGSNSNHLDWYGRIPTLTSSLGRLNFSEFKGTANHLILQGVKYGGAVLDGQSSFRADWNIYNRFPGIMVHDFAPTFGSLTSTGNDTEEMARLIYANIRRVISGRRNYDSRAVLQYIMAVGSLQAAFGELHRVLAAVRNRSMFNKYYGERLVEALGYNYDELVANYNNYVSVVNSVALSAETLAIPTGIKIFDRWYWLSSSVFSDSEDIRSGIIAFRPRGYWVWRKISEISELSIEALKESIRINYAPETATSTSSAQLGVGIIGDDPEFAPYGLYLEAFPTIGTENSGGTSRFQSIVNSLRRTVHEYIDNHDFNLIAADLRKTYGDEAIAVQQFQPGTKLSITYDPFVNMACKNITYVPFEPGAILEFPLNAWKSKGHKDGLVYVMYANESLITPLDNAMFRDGDQWVYRSELLNPQNSYVYSLKEEIDEKEAMSLLKWQVRYRVTSPPDGNVIITRRFAPDGINPLRNVGIQLQSMSTEVITQSAIYGVIDHLRGASATPTQLEAINHSALTTYGQIYYTHSMTNYVFIPQYQIKKEDMPDAEDELRARREWRAYVVAQDVLSFAAWGRHWDSCPAIYLVVQSSLNNKRTTGHLLHNTDLMALNPWPHYTVIDSNTVKRHHEVALASMVGLGSWGTGSINSEQHRSAPGMESGAFTKDK